MNRRRAWWMAGLAAAAALLFGGVFWASLNREKRLQTLNGPGPHVGAPSALPPDLQRSRERVQPVPPGLDPRTQEALRTLSDINRINRLNAENQRRAQQPPPPPTPPKN